MSDQPANPNDPSYVAQQVTPNMAVARVPERIGRGALATGFMVYTGPQEFVIDFIQGVARPVQLVARVVLSPAVTEQFVAALQDNLSKYVSSFGSPPTMPRNPNDKPPSAQEIYEQLKIPEDIQSGQYANSVAIRHSPAEFHFDFITNFYPHGSVSARLYLAAPRVPGLLETLTGSVNAWHRARSQGQGNPPQPPLSPGPRIENRPDDPPSPPPPSPRAYPHE